MKSAELDLENSALVYPQILPLRTAQDETPSATLADEHVGSPPSGDDVAGLREFVPGDALGRVHWKRSLRSGRLLVGEREGDASGEIEVLLRLNPNSPKASIETTISRAASEVAAHLDAGLRVGLRSASHRFPPATEATHRREMLTYLARVTADSLAPRGIAQASSPDLAQETG